MTRRLSTLVKVSIVVILVAMSLGRAGVRTSDRRPSAGPVADVTAVATEVVCSDRPPGDVDGNCHSDLSDFTFFSTCLAGPAAGPSKACPVEDFAISDVDLSGHADLHDFAGFQNGFGQTGGFAMPDDWGGTWQVTLTARDCASEEIVAVDEYEDLVCPGEALADGLIRLFDDCPAVVAGDAIMADCQRGVIVDGCIVRFVLDLDVLRTGETLAGEAQWFGELEGICDLFGSAPCEVVAIEGQRISTDVASCGMDAEGQP